MLKLLLTQPEEKKLQSLHHYYKKQHKLRELLALHVNDLIFTEDPNEATFIIFIGGINGEHNEYIKRNIIYKRFKKKCYLISDSGYGLKSVKGIYTSISKIEYNKSIHEPGWYFPLSDLREHAIDNKIFKKENITCTFRGDLKTHKVRQEIHELIKSGISKINNYKSTNTDGRQIKAWIDYDPSVIMSLKNSFIQDILDSEFVLCPRGYNTSSMRIYEVMSLGRVPIIISDNWIRPRGPKWSKFSITIKEKEIYKLDEIVSKFAGKSRQMGEFARKEWEKWFSLEVYAKHMLSSIRKLEKRKKCFWPKHYMQLFNVKYLNYFIKSYTLK
jgi:hypothetical protein